MMNKKQKRYASRMHKCLTEKYSSGTNIHQVIIFIGDALFITNEFSMTNIHLQCIDEKGSWQRT